MHLSTTRKHFTTSFGLILILFLQIVPKWVHCSRYNVPGGDFVDNVDGKDSSDNHNNDNYNNVEPNLNTLKLVFLIHRHGDRTPIETYPRDPYRNESEYWPDGWGQLTLNGKKRMYELGRYLSKRYEMFLGKSPREVYVRSSSSDRCLESAQLILSGLYPPVGRWKWNNELGQHWQPFPIQTVPHEQDGMLNPGSKCHRAEQIIQEIYNSPQVMDYYNQVKSTLLYVQDNTGYENAIDLIKAEEIFDSLLIEKSNGLKLPAWVDNNVYEKLKDISAKTFVFSGMNRQIQKLRAGLLLGDIWQRIQSIPLNPIKRLYVYSTHDTQLSVLLSALDSYNQLAPPFGASILLELHQSNATQFLKAFYLNVTESHHPYSLRLNDCQQRFNTAQSNSQTPSCTIENFYESIKDLIPDNWIAECQNPTLPNQNGPADEVSMLFMMTYLAACAFAMICMVFFYVSLRRWTTSYTLLRL